MQRKSATPAGVERRPQRGDHAWLHERAAAEPGLVVVAPDIEVQKLARFTDGVGYHWIYRTTTWDELDYLFRERGARTCCCATTRPTELRRPAIKRASRTHFTREAGDLSGFSVFRRRRCRRAAGHVARAAARGARLNPRR
jgi:hypothetical protein